jgi:hypothetical protein
MVGANDRLRGRAGHSSDRYFDFKNDYKGQITFFSWKFSMNFCRALRIQEVLACSHTSAT